MIIRRPMRVNKVWGWEEWTHNSELYCGKLLHVLFGARCSLHYHKRKHETFTVVRGSVHMEVGDCIAVMEVGDTVDILPGQLHRFRGLSMSTAIIMEVSTQHFEDDSIREEPSRGPQ